jgi:hypothetical protein
MILVGYRLRRLGRLTEETWWDLLGVEVRDLLLNQDAKVVDDGSELGLYYGADKRSAGVRPLSEVRHRFVHRTKYAMLSAEERANLRLEALSMQRDIESTPKRPGDDYFFELKPEHFTHLRQVTAVAGNEAFVSVGNSVVRVKLEPSEMNKLRRVLGLPPMQTGEPE